MNTVILFATRYGSTENIAKLIWDKLPGEAKMVNIAKQQVPDISTFDAVVIGGPVYAGKLLKPLAAYMRQNLEELKKKKLALFLCAGEQEPLQIEKMIASNFPAELCSRAVFKGALGGELKLENLSRFMKFVLKNLIKVKEGYSRVSEENINALVRAVGG